jgi:serine/threonine-protein phosphatase 5
VLLSNRSFAQFKLENYGFAEADAAKAIELDPTFVKGYYRRGSALIAMGKLKEAIKALKTCSLRVPSDASVKTKLAQAKKDLRAIQFAECIESSLSHAAVDTDSIEVPESYTGPVLPEVMTTEWVQDLMLYLKGQNKLHKKFVIQLLQRVKQVFSRCRSLVDISVPADGEFTICGDVHGQFYDLLNIFTINGLPSPSNPYLFNGDFVDRGSFSVEVILTLLAWKLTYPDHFHLTRGNHESKSMNKIYGFEGEVLHKYDITTMDLFYQVFCELPLCCVINQRVLVLHGGLFSQDGVTLDDLRKIDRVKEPPESGLMCECLWSDPCKMNGRHPSKRGVGLMFGPDVAARFLDANGLSEL